MGEWWISLSSLEKFFWYFAIPFTLLLLIQSVLTIFGLTDDGDIDFDASDTDIDGDFYESSFNLFSIRNFIAFFSVFGWAGITFLNMGLSPVISTIAAIITGFIVSLIISMLYYYILRLSESGNIDLNNAIGNTGEVYLTIPKNRNGIGKVHVVIQGTLKEVEAMTNDKEIKTSKMIKVVDVINDSVLLVEELK